MQFKNCMASPKPGGTARCRHLLAALEDWRGRARAGVDSISLARARSSPHGGAMFCVDEETAAAIRRVFDEEGELSAVVELRRHFPLITDNVRGRECVRIIAGWQPVPPPAKAADRVARLKPRRRPTAAPR